MANSDYNQQGNGSFTPLAELAQPLDHLSEVVFLKNRNYPIPEAIRPGMSILMDDEILLLDTITQDGITAKRGCGDTRPWEHSVGALVWFLDNAVGSDQKEYSGGEDVAVKITPWTIGGGTFPIASAPPNDLTMNFRFFRPYTPGRMIAKGNPWFIPAALSANDPDLIISWADRDRVLQADKLIDHTQDNIGPEPGVSYTLRIFDSNDVLKRTETGIIGTGSGPTRVNQFVYQWSQAMSDLGFTGDPETSQIIGGNLHFCAAREGFDSWQDYIIPFTVDTQGFFLRAAQLSQLVAQPSDEDQNAVTPSALYAAQMAAMTIQMPGDETPGAGAGEAPTAGMFVAAMQTSAGQSASFYTQMFRNLFEAPYTLLKKLGGDPVKNHLVTVAARPSDRLTDTHRILARYNFPKGTGDVNQYLPVANPSFTPWITLKFGIPELERTATIRTSSFFDGIPLTSVQPGQMGMMGAEIIRVASISETEIVLDRGCCDTIPQRAIAGTRIWFFEAAAGNDPTDYPWTTVPQVGASVQVKFVPNVFGPALTPNDVPTDIVDFAQRTERPYPPGRVVVNSRPWFEGVQTRPGETVHITWAHRNRVSQGGNVVDHTAPDIAPEDGQKYRLRMQVLVPSRQAGVPPSKITIRDDIVDGNFYDYPYEFALADGNRVGRLLGICGFVSIDLFLQSIRGEFESWQGYSISMLLPSYACPPGQTPGGGQVGNSDPGNGNGDTGGTPPGTPGDNTGDSDPVNNGGGADDGNGPPAPPPPPPDWPVPVDPPPQPNPDDPNPELQAHWDTNWDRHWDAFTQDDIGGNT